MNIKQLTSQQRAELAQNTIKNGVMLGEWSDVKDIPAENLKKWTNDPDKLHGLIFKAYEMKWGAINTNGELYDETAFDKFIEDYFVQKGFNMPVTIEHSQDPDWIAGRVLYIERNSVGFYFVLYIPDTYKNYAQVKWMVEEGLLQGLSKEGFYLDYEWELEDEDNWDSWYIHVHELMMSRVSLVTTPANGVKFESAKETKNAVVFNKPKSVLESIIQKKA